MEITKNGRHPDGRNRINQLDEKTKVLFRLDVGEHAHEIRSMGYDVVNHMNIEIQRLSASGDWKPKWDYHIILDELGNAVEGFPLGAWTK